MTTISIDPVGAQVVRTALNLGLFQQLQGAESDLQSLSDSLSVSPRGLRPLLHLLSSLQLIRETGGRYRVAGGLNDFLVERWPDLNRDLPVPKDWDKLEEAVRTGTCVRRSIEGKADAGQFFSGIVDTLFRLHFGLAKHVGSILPQSIEKVLDLGAGSAVWSLGVLTHNDSAKVVAVDLEKVLQEVTARFVREKGLADRYELRAGSYHDVELEPGHYDLVYLGHVIHSEGWEASRSLLKRCRAALRKGGMLAISEWVGSVPRGDDYHANLFDLNMLMFTEKGLVFDAEEMEALVREAGFPEHRWEKGPGQYPVLIATRD